MKNLFLAVTAAMALLCSCSKENDEILAPVKGGTVTVSFVDESSLPGTQSRAFFATTAAAETWEKQINSMTLYVFKMSSGELILRRPFTAAEVAAKQAEIVIPGVTTGDNCDFYAVANMTLNNITDKASLLAALETEPGRYNGEFQDVSVKANRPGGFVMSGFITQAIAEAGSTNNVSIVLKRTVAKIAMETIISSKFTSRYPGLLMINSVTLHNGASQTPVIKPTTKQTGAMSFTTAQRSHEASGKYQNLFYIYENPVDSGNKVYAVVNATYDADGDSMTTADRSMVEYYLSPSGEGNGVFNRNGYYRISISIDGLIGNAAAVTVYPAEWETPVTQEVNVGK